MKRRIYKLKTKFTLLGLDGVDWGILFGTFVLTVNFFKNTLGDRSALLISLIVTALVYMFWNLVKDNVPEKFSTHLFTWLGEPEVYKVVPDTKNIPLVVRVEEIQRHKVLKEKARKQMSKQSHLVSGRRDSWL